MTMEAYKFSVRTYDVDGPMHLNSLNQTLSARNEILPQTLRSQDFEKDSPPLKTHRGYKTVQNNS
jgi:hypothetical protein